MSTTSDDVSEAVFDPDSIDTYEFWGIILKEGRVRPVNIDREIYYPAQVVRQSGERVVGTDVRIDHVNLPNSEDAKLGELVDYELHDDKLFVKGTIERDRWENFVEVVSEGQNGIIDVRYNDLVREVHAGNLALSAGPSVATAATQIHPNTVVHIGEYREVSLVGKPASPASYAWGCDDSCRLVFGEQSMSDNDSESQDVELDFLTEGAEQSAEEGEENDNEEGEEQQTLLDAVSPEQSETSTVTIDGEEFKLVPSEQADDDCTHCSELGQKVEQLKEERDKYVEMLKKVEQRQQEDLQQKIESLNEDVPDDAQYEEEELNQMFEDSSVSELRQTANVMERLVPAAASTSQVSQSEEDLSGSSSAGATSEEEDKREQVNQVSQNLFGKDLDEKMKEIEEKYEGEA